MCLAAIQFVAIAWFNYRHVYGALDMDAAMGIRQNIEQWKHGLFWRILFLPQRCQMTM